jgi:hypothetical protein
MLFSWGYRRGPLTLPGTLDGRDVEPGDWGVLLEWLERWLGAHPPARVERVCRKPGNWYDLARLLPPPRDRVPRTFWPDFATGFDAALLREPDVQVLTGPIPPRFIVGAIRVTDGHRIRRELRPERGRTLEANLWSWIHELRRARRRPIVR